MKITDVVVRRVDIPHPVPYRHQWEPPGFLEYSRAASIVKVETDVGLSGWGITNRDCDAAIRQVVAPALRGQDPRAVDRHIDVLRATEAFVVDTIDENAMNDFFETQDDNIIDFSESNPFGDIGK